MRLMFTGAAPWANSGYSKPLRYLLPRLVSAGHECAIACFYGLQGLKSTFSVEGELVTLYPIARDPYFNDLIEKHAADFGADVVISHQDVWILDGWAKRGFKWCPWMPVDTWPVDRQTKAALNGCTMPISYSQWGQEQLREAGWPDARYIPIGVDTEMYRPTSQSQARAKAGLPDGYLAGMVAANSSYPSRKSFPEVLQAWQRWKRAGNEGTLYLHTTISSKKNVKAAGLELSELLNTLELPWATLDDPDEEHRNQATVLFPNQYRLWTGDFDDLALADVYNSLDVLLSPSMGEGFGIPILEAQACGVPVITLHCSSMPELNFAGLSLPPIQWAWEGRGGWRGVAGVTDLVGAIKWGMEVRHSDDVHVYVRRKATDYDWSRLTKTYWVPFLEELAA